MRRSTLILAAGLMLAGLVAEAQNAVDGEGRRQGRWLRTDKDGSKIYEGVFVDGLETGIFTYYYPNGMVRIRNTYTEPGKRCTHEAFDDQGHLVATGEYDRRNRDGQWKFYAEDGRLVKEASYRMGIKEGRHTVFNRQGDTAEVAHWKENRRHGRWWRRVGDKGYITGTYVNGGLEGRLEEYDEEGRLARSGNYKDGLRHGSYRYYTGGRLTVDERWTHGMLSDRKILLLCPEERYESVYDIVCLAAQGKSRVVVYLRDGTKLTTNEGSDVVFDRLGTERFVSANRKSRVMVARESVQGVGRDSEGRETLLMEPQPDFPIYPDEDCLKMVKALQYEEHSPLDDIRDR